MKNVLSNKKGLPNVLMFALQKKIRKRSYN